MPEKSVEELQRAKEAAAGAERQAAMAATLTGVATELGNVTGGSLTVPAEVFRQRELSSAALAAAAQKVAGTITSATSTMPVLVTSRTDQAQSALAARSFFAAIDGLRAAATDLIGRTTRLLAQAEVDVEEPKAAEKPPAVPSDPIAAAAALAVAALNLLTVETTVTAASGTATELETHVPVIHQLLATQVPVLHSSIGIPPAGNRVLEAFAELAPLSVRLDAIAAAAAEEITRLGKDPPADQLQPLTERKTQAETLSAAMVAFVTAAQTIDPATGTSPLLGAAAADALWAGPDAAAAYVAIVVPARIDAHQVALKRRLGASRLVVSSSATIDVVVLDVTTGAIVAAATHTEARAFQVRFPMWFRWWRSEQEHPSNPRYTPVPAPPLS